MSAAVGDLGLVIDANLDVTAHISNVIKSCYCHLRSLRKLQPFLTQDAANAIAVSLIMFRLGYYNSGLLSLPANQLKCLQKIQNAAACIVTRTKSQQHITPVLWSLHWLPVTKWIEYKSSVSPINVCIKLHHSIHRNQFPNTILPVLSVPVPYAD